MKSEMLFPFWLCFDRHGSAPALIDARSGIVLTYSALAHAVHATAEALCANKKRLILLPLDNRLEDVVRYLGALASGHVVCPYNVHTSDEALSGFIRDYRPDLTAGRASRICAGREGFIGTSIFCEKFVLWPREAEPPLDSALTLMLSTSGSTGPGRYVRLSADAVAASAGQVSQMLGIVPNNIAVTSLPLTYVYGLSILHSHLAAGAALVIEPRSVLEKSFWQTVRRHHVTSFAGVPWTYRLLHQVGIGASDFPQLRIFTTAGGRMPKPLRTWLETIFLPSEAQLFHMYGQTEACGRITVLPPELMVAKAGSVGKMVPGGRIQISAHGTLLFAGPNVMMGYANDRADLARRAEIDWLDTGDLASLDADGFVYLSGRCKRIAKIYGLRLNLDEAQAWLGDQGVEVALSQRDEDRLSLCHAAVDTPRMPAVLKTFARRFGIPYAALLTEQLPFLARSASGKLIFNQPSRMEAI